LSASKGVGSTKITCELFCDLCSIVAQDDTVVFRKYQSFPQIPPNVKFAERACTNCRAEAGTQIKTKQNTPFVHRLKRESKNESSCLENKISFKSISFSTGSGPPLKLQFQDALSLELPRTTRCNTLSDSVFSKDALLPHKRERKRTGIPLNPCLVGRRVVPTAR